MPAFKTRAKSILWICLLLTITACSSGDNAKEANCDSFIVDTRATCMDMIRRGLDVSCSTYLGAVSTAMSQAGGDLFDVGDANESAADAFCSTYGKKLREDRDEHTGTMHAQDQTGPKCRALADRFETRCMENLGKQALPGNCKNVARTFVAGASRQMPQEQLCSLAGMQLPKE